MEMSVACVNQSLWGGDRLFLSITCSKQKKKASGKLKTPPSFAKKKFGSKNLKLVQDGDMFLGMGAGASTLTTLRPLVDQEDSLPQILEKIPRGSITEQQFDPLSSSNLDSLKYLDIAKHGQRSASAHGSLYVDIGNQQDASHDGNRKDGNVQRSSNDLSYGSDENLGKVSGSLHDAPYANDEAEYVSSHEKRGNRYGDYEEEFEWVEVNVEDERAESHDTIMYWEGDSTPLTEEEEAKILKEAQRELEGLEKEKKTRSFAYASNIMNWKTVGEDNDDNEDEGADEDDDEETLLLEAEAELLEFEARASKLHNAESTWVLDQLKKEIYDEEDDREEEDDGEEEDDDDGEGEDAGEEEDDDDDDDEEDAGTDMNEKEGVKDKVKPLKRAIPAIMRSFDKAKIYAKAGNGGNGVVAFRREKFVPFGGPSGGSGGRGGHVYVEADPSMNSMLPFRRSVHFRAGRGSHGLGKSQDGAAGEDCIIKVPLGTVVRQATDELDGSGEVLLELMRPYQRELLLPGGRGGRGNTAFKTGRNKTPQIAELGEEGAEMWLELELKLVADVGIIGVPNAGKSTLLSVISAAQPKIGSYPFTTLLPNLGVVPIGMESSMVVADLPGLLEGAHLGTGLGHEFLRHTERCRVLVHIVDGMSQQPEQEYEAVRLELELFNPSLAEKPFVVAFNKMDVPEASDRWNNFQAYLKRKGVEALCMSAATKMGTQSVVMKAFSLLQSLPTIPVEYTTDESHDKDDKWTVGEAIRRQRNAPIEEFEIFGSAGSKEWRIEGIGLERFTQMTNWEYFESLKRFQHVLNISGVNAALRNRGVSEGNTVIVGEMEFIWQDTEDLLATNWKRGFRGSRLWPH